MIILCLVASLAQLSPLSQPEPTQAELLAMEQELSIQLEPVSFERVTLGDGFWRDRLEVVRTETIPLVLERCFETGRVKNLQIAGGLAEGEFQGRLYDDSDVYKALEGVAKSLILDAASPAAVALKARADIAITAIEAAQCDDGYISSYYCVVNGADHDVSKRWTNVAHGHELYCIGHLIEAGVAWKRATGESRLLDVAVRAADHVASVFLGQGKRNDPPGHQELELALFALAELTGDGRHAALATDLLERRGQTEWNGSPREKFGEYSQDHLPMRGLSAPVGHAVRLMYQLSAMTDFVRRTGDIGVLGALESTWVNLNDGHVYVTGGIGASASNEGFGEPYELPDAAAYNETCAGIGMVMWNQRMGLLTGKAKYFGQAERALHNNVLAGLSLDGKRFFYVNPLASEGGHHRVPWFDCSCCPTNLARTLPAVGGLVFARADPEGAPPVLAVLQDIAAEVTFEVDGAKVHVRQFGGPLGEDPLSRQWIEITCEEPREFAFRTRMREGAIGVIYEVESGAPFDPEAGEVADLAATAAGWMRITRTWRGTSRIRASNSGGSEDYTFPDRELVSHKNRAAFLFGPFVYALEADTNTSPAQSAALKRFPIRELGEDAFYLKSTPSAATSFAGLPMLDVAGLRNRGDGVFEEEALALIPYFAWDNSGAGDMRVWLPTDPALTTLPSALYTASVEGMRLTASHCYRGDSVESLLDASEPRASNDPSLKRHTFWDHRGTEEWLHIELDKPKELSKVSVYWFDDTGFGSCSVPSEWYVEVREDGEWKRVGEARGTLLDTWNEAAFEPRSATELRLVIQLQVGLSAGLLGLRLE